MPKKLLCKVTQSQFGSIIGTVAVAIFLVLVSLSCKTNADEVVDWYEEQDEAMRGRFPTMAICDRNERKYWRFAAEVEEISGNYTRAMTGVAQTGNQAGVQSLGRELQQYVRLRESAFLVASGWSEEDYGICTFWLAAKRDPRAVCTDEAEFPAHLLGYGHYGSLRYCIENSIPPF